MGRVHTTSTPPPTNNSYSGWIPNYFEISVKMYRQKNHIVIIIGYEVTTVNGERSC